MKTLINIYAAVIGKIEFLNDRGLHDWLRKTQKEHKSVSYFIKRSIITNNLFGVDIMEEAIEIAKLRLFLALVASANSVDDLEPLPNIEFNIMTGNSLIGLMHVDENDFDKFAHDLASKAFFKDYRQVLEEKNHLIGLYRRATAYAEDLQSLRDGIEEKKQKAVGTLNRLLLDQFQSLGIKYEEATWDSGESGTGVPPVKNHGQDAHATGKNMAKMAVPRFKKRPLAEDDIKTLKPFHWGFEFDEIINQSGGFDAIITNPPWEVFEASEKEFFQEYVPEIQKKTLRIEDWQKQFKTIMKQEVLRSAWLAYASGFSHASAYLRSAPQYTNQQSFDSDGRRLASKINLYKVFVEQCVNLLRSDGYCGMVIPSGIYNELGAKQLREMLFSKTTLTGIFGFDNRKEIFEGVHRSFKFVALTLRKSGSTHELPVVFMRTDVSDLARFPTENALLVSVDLIQRLSPDSLSILEFKREVDVRIAEKMLRHPLLGDEQPDCWTVRLAQEINMTSDNKLFRTKPATGLRPLFEGKMIWQFESHFSEPRGTGWT